MSEQKRIPRPLRLYDDEAAPIAELADRETEGNFSMALRKLIVEALDARRGPERPDALAEQSTLRALLTEIMSTPEEGGGLTLDQARAVRRMMDSFIRERANA